MMMEMPVAWMRRMTVTAVSNLMQQRAGGLRRDRRRALEGNRQGGDAHEHPKLLQGTNRFG